MLTIGQVASQAGLRPSAIRYYESLGLLPVAVRKGGKRMYDGSILDRLAAIELAKAAGFGLEEIRDLVASRGEASPGSTWKKLARRKDAEIDEQITRLGWSKFALTKIARCTCPTLEECGRRFASALAKLPADPPTGSGLPRKPAPRRRAHADRLIVD